VLESLVETTISRDVLLLSRIDKPALLRRLFQLGCVYSGQVLSYQKMLGQLQDAGNTVTLAHYLELLSGAGMVTGLPKFAGQQVRRRGSSPKLQVLNTALMTTQSGLSFEQARRDPEYWGRLVESAVGAHLLNEGSSWEIEVSYWRERDREVDFVARRGPAIVGIEVKTGAAPTSFPGMDRFFKAFGVDRGLIVGERGIPIEEFLSRPLRDTLGTNP
jgi:hypothetical protein